MEGTGEREKTFLDRVLADSIFVDFAEEPIFGVDSVFICKKNHRFGTVTIKLMNTDTMVSIFDGIRMEAGMKPMHPHGEYTEEMCDRNGWYELTFTMDTWNEGASGFIECIVQSEDEPDHEELYTLELTIEEGRKIVEVINGQFEKYKGYNCQHLLDRAKELANEKEV